MSLFTLPIPRPEHHKMDDWDFSAHIAGARDQTNDFLISRPYGLIL